MYAGALRALHLVVELVARVGGGCGLRRCAGLIDLGSRFRRRPRSKKAANPNFGSRLAHWRCLPARVATRGAHSPVRNRHAHAHSTPLMSGEGASAFRSSAN